MPTPPHSCTRVPWPNSVTAQSTLPSPHPAEKLTHTLQSHCRQHHDTTLAFVVPAPSPHCHTRAHTTLTCMARALAQSPALDSALPHRVASLGLHVPPMYTYRPAQTSSEGPLLLCVSDF